MYRAMRYPDTLTALRVGNLLDRYFDREWLTGLNFIVEPGGSVIIVAHWDDDHVQPEAGFLEGILTAGEPVDADPDELVTEAKVGHLYFLGDGLEPFKLYVLNRTPLESG